MRGGTRKPVAGGRALYRVVDPPGSFVDEPDAGRVVLQDLHPLAPAGLVERGAETGVVTNQCRVHLFLVGGPSRALSLADVEDAQLPLRLRASCTTGPRGHAARSPPLAAPHPATDARANDVLRTVVAKALLAGRASIGWGPRVSHPQAGRPARRGQSPPQPSPSPSRSRWRA